MNLVAVDEMESGEENLRLEPTDLTITAPSIEAWRDTQHAPLRTPGDLVHGPKEGEAR
jgi:hypothetical protein